MEQATKSNGFYQANQSMFISWLNVDMAVSQLAKDLAKNGGYDTIIGISRGGLVPSVMLSDQLKLPLITVDAEYYRHGEKSTRASPIVYSFSKLLRPFDRYLIVDDVLDSGETLSSVVNAMRGDGVENIKIAVLVNKTDKTKIGKYSLKSAISVNSDLWVVFPWSRREHGGIKQ